MQKFYLHVKDDRAAFYYVIGVSVDVGVDESEASGSRLNVLADVELAFCEKTDLQTETKQTYIKNQT